MASKIKRGVSLYSFQHETIQGSMTLEDCVRTCAGMGAMGIEVIGEQTFWGWPEQGMPDDKIAEWHAVLRRHGAVAVAHDAMLDTKRRRGQLLAFEAQVASMKRDIDFAARLGVKYIRALVFISPDVLVAAAPYAEAHNIKLLLEVHAPLHFDDPWIIRHAEAYEKSGSPALGFLPDMGMFLFRYPRVWKERFVRDGCPQAIADYIERAFEDRVLGGYVMQQVRDMGGQGVALAMAETLNHNAAYEPRRMLEHMGRIHDIHGKFYEMTEALEEYSIPYDRIVAVLDEGGYDGYICSEYEGNRWVEDAEPVRCVEQVRRHQEMLKRLTGHTAATISA